MSQWCVVLILAISVGVGGAVLATTDFVGAEGARSEVAGSKAPFDLNDPRAVEEGSHLFRANCTHYCHNPEGRAARAPALRGRDLAPDFVYQRIAKGLAPMPAFETRLSFEQIWKLVAYVESLAQAKD
jgi:mono/diheme cytochrome c family protein